MLDGPPGGDLVGELEVPAVRHAARDPRDLNALLSQLARDQQRRRLAVDRGRGGDEHLADVVRRHPGQEAVHPDLVATDTVERREQASEDVVFAAHRAALLDREQVLHPRHDAEERAVSAAVAANRADGWFTLRAHVGDVAALRAGADAVVQLDERLPQIPGDRFVRRQKGDGVTLRGLLADARELREELDDAQEPIGEHGAAGRSMGTARPAARGRGSSGRR